VACRVAAPSGSLGLTRFPAEPTIAKHGACLKVGAYEELSELVSIGVAMVWWCYQSKKEKMDAGRSTIASRFSGICPLP
jgi:hypothetical protein